MLLILLAALLLLILAIFIVFLIARKRNTSLKMTEYYKDYSEMSEEELASYVESARDEYAKWAGVQGGETLESGVLEPGTAPLNPTIKLSERVKLLIIPFLASPDTILEVIQQISKRCILKGNEKALRTSTRLARLELKASKPGVRAISRLGLKAAAKALTAAASRLATTIAIRGALLATGPVGVAVNAALFVMQATFGMMDQFGVGGYEELVSERVYIGMRDYYDREHKEYCKENNIPYPQVKGPLDRISEEQYLQELSQESASVFEDEEHPITRYIIALLEQFYQQNGRDPTDEEYDTLIENDPSNLAVTWHKYSLERLATKYNGKIVMVEGIPHCSYKTREEAESSFNWPLEDEKLDFYVEWDEDAKISVIRPSIMRTYSESLGFGCYYDKVRRLPHITEEYCLENGLYHDGQGKQCRYKEGQDIAEAIFGKAFVRGLLQVFDPDMYKPCSEMDWCSDGKCKDDGAYFCTKNELSYLRRGIEPRCPPGYTETTEGFCNRDCPPGYFRMRGDQMCYNERIKENNNVLIYPIAYSCYDDTYRCGDDAGIVTAATRCYDCYCAVRGGWRDCCWVSNKCPGRTGPEFKYARKRSCKPGYRSDGASCVADSRPLSTGLPKLGEQGIGECPDGTSKYLRGDALCYAPCKEGYDGIPGGMCNANSPKLQIKPKERKAPYGKTDFENSPVGMRVQAIKDNIREGDVAGVAAGLGALYLQTNPFVVGAGLQDFANMIPDV